MAHGPPARKKLNNALNAEEEEEDQDQGVPVPPDGGWGWVVVFGSFMIHVISKYIFVCELYILYLLIHKHVTVTRCGVDIFPLIFESNYIVVFIEFLHLDTRYDFSSGIP